MLGASLMCSVKPAGHTVVGSVPIWWWWVCNELDNRRSETIYSKPLFVVFFFFNFLSLKLNFQLTSFCFFFFSYLCICDQVMPARISPVWRAQMLQRWYWSSCPAAKTPALQKVGFCYLERKANKMCCNPFASLLLYNLFNSFCKYSIDLQLSKWPFC